ncbi:hypothetical protein [Blautia sp.]
MDDGIAADQADKPMAENCPHILLQNAAENQKLFFSFVSSILTKADCYYNEIRS